MDILHKFITRKQNNHSNKPIFKLFLTGIEGQIRRLHYPKPYNFYINFGSLITIFLLAKWILSFRKTQIEKRGNNLLIPEYIYKVREQSHKYWQLVRLAKGQPTTFTNYQWDQNIMYEIDRSGKQTPVHTHPSRQDSRTFTSPLHQYLFPASAETHNKILMYLKNIDNPYDLNNYLRQKSINIGDWIRAGYYFIYRQLGLTNRWRYDEFIRKPDIYYRWEKLKFAYRLSRDRKTLYKTLDVLQFKWDDTIKFLFWFL